MLKIARGLLIACSLLVLMPFVGFFFVILNFLAIVRFGGAYIDIKVSEPKNK